MPEVTIISLFYNRADGVDISARSLAKQRGIAFKAVLIDDGSTDDTLHRLSRYCSDRIEVQSRANRGFTQSLADACAAVDTPFIAIHGAGDESLPERLEEQVRFLHNHPDVVAVGCNIENIDVQAGKRWTVEHADAVRCGPIAGNFGISHGEVMFRTAAYRQVGGYRTLFPLGQATDLFRRLSRAGNFGYVQRTLYRRYLRADGVSSNMGKIAQRDILAALSRSAHLATISAESIDTGRDGLDRFGLLYPYFAPPDRDVAIALARASVKLWLAGDRETALILVRRSLREQRTLQGHLIRAALTAGRGPLRSLVHRMIANTSNGEAEFALKPGKDGPL